MCGIVGFLTPNPTQEHLEIFSRMLLADEERGGDATGMMWPTLSGIKVHKQEGGAEACLASWNKTGMRCPKWMVGHNRLATKGKPEVNVNNHPVVSGSLALVHNGVVHGEKDIDTLELPGGAEVDSQIIVEAIDVLSARHSLTKAVSLATDYFTGSYACVLASTSNTNKLYMFRNNSSPLELVWLPEIGTLLFGSDEDILLEGVETLESMLNGLMINRIRPEYHARSINANTLLEINSNFAWDSTVLSQQSYYKRVPYDKGVSHDSKWSWYKANSSPPRESNWVDYNTGVYLPLYLAREVHKLGLDPEVVHDAYYNFESPSGSEKRIGQVAIAAGFKARERPSTSEWYIDYLQWKSNMEKENPSWGEGYSSGTTIL